MAAAARQVAHAVAGVNVQDAWAQCLDRLQAARSR